MAGVFFPCVQAVSTVCPETVFEVIVAVPVEHAFLGPVREGQSILEALRSVRGLTDEGDLNAASIGATTHEHRAQRRAVVLGGEMP